MAMSEKAAAKFLALDAIRFCETWREDVPVGQVTDFRQSVIAEADGVVVFSWLEWPNKAALDAAGKRLWSIPNASLPPPHSMANA